MIAPREAGAALVTTLLAIPLLMALGTALVLTAMTEARIASSYRDGVLALHGAEAALERAIADLQTAGDIDRLLAGAAASPFVDGQPGGQRQLPGGVLDISEATNLVRCGHSAPCTAAELVALSDQRPWGRNNPVWQLFAHGPLASLIPQAQGGEHGFVVVWIGDDSSEEDDDPLADGQAPPGQGVVTLRAHAYGPGGVRRALQAVVARDGPSIRILSWHELR